MSGTPFDLNTWPARFGIKEGDTVQLMADVTRMAWNARRSGSRFDANELLNAFADAIGDDGLVLVPTFNFDLRDGDVFDVKRTRSISGALANAAITNQRFVRTSHALHSFAVAGGNAPEFARTHDAPGSFDADSPFGALKERKGVLLAFDLPLNDALTFAHFVEQAVGVPYREHIAFNIHHSDANGRVCERRFTAFVKKFGHTNDFTPLDPLLRKAGALSSGTIDGSQWLRVDLAAAYDVIADDIRLNKARSIHRFSGKLWLRDQMKAVLRTFGYRTRRERMAHAARTP